MAPAPNRDLVFLNDDGVEHAIERIFLDELTGGIVFFGSKYQDDGEPAKI